MDPPTIEFAFGLGVVLFVGLLLLEGLVERTAQAEAVGTVSDPARGIDSGA
jgi:hypothetical protein